LNSKRKKGKRLTEFLKKCPLFFNFQLTRAEEELLKGRKGGGAALPSCNPLAKGKGEEKRKGTEKMPVAEAEAA